MRMTRFHRTSNLARGIAGITLALLSIKAYAVPSFARQTGLPCAVCHDVPPQLTAFGRQFKLDGYVLTTMKQVDMGTDGKDLSINRIPPLSAMVQLSATTLTNEPAKDTENDTKAQNTNVEFPQQLSFFFAGEISPHIGSFLQFTYTNTGQSFGLDNTDFRYARETTLFGQSVTWGIDANNNPGVEDLWNDTPAWSFPWGHSNIAPSPYAMTVPLVNENLAQNVAGLGEYSMWNNTWYEDLAIYRTAQEGFGEVNPTTNYGANNICTVNNNCETGVINGVAPYWRLAWQHGFGNSYLEIGTFGMHAGFLGGFYGLGVPGVEDQYTDAALDSQFDHHFGADLLTLYATYVHEYQDLASSHAANPAVLHYQDLNNLRLTGTYQFGLHYQVGASYFNTGGTPDAAWYRAGNGSPGSSGVIARATYLPWENTQFTLQYTAYNRFGGETTNASKSNSLYLLAWFLW
ncbi:MAG: hypothetical protein ACYCXG_07125 [Acidiferrobacter sp.]